MSRESSIAPKIWSNWGLALSVGFSIWLATRVAMALLTYATMIFTPSAPGSGSNNFPPQTPLKPAREQLMIGLSQWGLSWDSAWYTAIAMRGYNWAGVHSLYVFLGLRPTAFPVVDPLEPMVFFPLYPLLTKAASVVLDVFPAPAYGNLLNYPYGLAALVVSNVCALVAFVAIAALAMREGYERHQVQLVVLLLAAYPVAFYLAAGYTEATLLASGALMLLFARRGQWIGAGLAAALGALARTPAVLIMLPLAWEYGRQHGWWPLSNWRTVPIRKRFRELALGLPVIFAAPAGTATYLLFLWRSFGDPLIFVRSEHWWKRYTAPPWEGIRLSVNAFVHAPATIGGREWQLLILLDGGLLVAFIVITLLTMRSLPVSFTLYSAVFLLASSITVSFDNPDPLTGTARYVLSAFPVFIGLAYLVRNRPGLQVGLVSSGFLLQGTLLTLWLAGNFID